MTYYDGRTRVANETDLRPGVILRLQNPDGSIGPFSDCIVDIVNEGIVFLSRPYATGSTKGVETFQVPIARLTTVESIFRIVLSARGYVMGGPCDD